MYNFVFKFFIPLFNNALVVVGATHLYSEQSRWTRVSPIPQSGVTFVLFRGHRPSRMTWIDSPSVCYFMSAHVEANRLLSFLLMQPCEIFQPFMLFVSFCKSAEHHVTFKHPAN